MANSCVYRPKGRAKQNLFDSLKSTFGYNNAAYIFNRVTHPEFIETYKNSLILDEGIPTYNSVMSNDAVINLIGEDSILESMNASQQRYDNTLGNTSMLIEQAHSFNTSPDNKKYVAYVDTDNDKLTLRYSPRSSNFIDIADNQYKIHKLNERITEVLSPIGITMSTLAPEEVKIGRVGVTDFDLAADTANGLASMMAVANNIEGYKAISEEFSHFIVGVYRNSPIVARSITALKNEDVLREILGDRFQDDMAFHDGNLDMVAEEALGHILRDTLLNNDSPSNLNQSPSRLKTLFKRAIDFIVRLFKGYNPAYIKESIDFAKANMSELAQQIFDQKTKITKQNVKDAQRKAKFNALSEKGNVQIETLKKIEERYYKNIELQQDLEDDDTGRYKKRAGKLASQVHKAIQTNVKEEETIAAIASLLKLSTKDLKKMYNDLCDIDNMSASDRFILLRNVLYTLQSYQPTIKELKDITESSYLEDEQIQNQKFVVGDISDKIRDFEAEEPVEPVDTSGKEPKAIADMISEDSKEWKLSKDETCYINKNSRERAMRVTKAVSVSMDSDSFDQTDPWYTPSTNIGTGIDEFIRDFLGDRFALGGDGKYIVDGRSLSSVYPNASEESLQKLAKQLDDFKKDLDQKGITLVTRDVTVNGTVTVMDAQGRPHQVRVAGTLDLLGYDEQGNFYVYDIKTFRSSIDGDKEQKYAQQVTLYKDFLEKKYGIKVKEMAIVPIKVEYPTPKGFGKGKAKYTVNSNKPDGYKGVKGNQLNINGKAFKGANPEFKGIRVLNEKKTTINYGQLGGESGNVNVESTLEALNTVDRMFTQLGNLFEEKAQKYVSKFFSDFIGNNIKIREVNEETGEFTGKLVEVSLDKVLSEAPKDTTLIQRWVTTMADNPDAYMQIYDHIFQKKKHEKRLKMIDKAREIIALGKKYEKLGIRSYNWMFEDDKKNYIIKFEVDGNDYSFDKSAYEKAKANFIKELDSKYGEFPEVGTNDFTQKNEELVNWINANTIEVEVPLEKKNGKKTMITKTIPSPTKYPSKYNSLSQVQKDFYDEWMAIKEELDDCLPKGTTTTTNTIKIRRSGYERLQDATSGNLNKFIDGVKARFVQSFDDENNYSKGIKGFAGEEVMRLPILYVNANETEDITTDVIGSLVAYADMCYNYEAMNEIVDPFEIGRYLAQTRKINKSKGGKRLFEEFSFGDVSIKNPLYEDNTSNFMAELNDFMESKIYNKHLKDAGAINVGKKQLDAQKTAGEALKLGSMVQLGFNAMAGIANIATGLSMQRIEAVAGEFFNMRELHRADVEFGKASAAFVTDIGQRIKNSKLALFDELFDVRQNFSKEIRHLDFKKRNLLLRIFGPNIQYICQDAGDHWMYNRSAIAIALRYKLKDANGNEISLWDALETVDIDSNNPSAGKKLVLKKGVTKTDGSQFTNEDIMQVSNRIKYINQHCFGVYNEEDSVAARRTILGRFLMQYRDWIPAQMVHRFGRKTTNFNKGIKEDGTAEEVEGYYRTFGRFIMNIVDELKNGEYNIKQCWSELDDYDKANVKRAIAEITQLIGVYIIAGLLKGSKKKDRKYSWARNMLGYIATREKTELGALVPVVQMGEMINLVKSPAAATSVLSDIYNLRLLLDPRNYFDEIQNGTFKGHSSAYRAFMRSPLTLYYRTLNRQLHPEKAETFYHK